MRKLALFTTVVCLISFYYMHAHAQQQAAWDTTVQGYHYVGATTTKYFGGPGGRTVMNSRCQPVYGPTAHMCDVDEFFSTSNLPAPAGTTTLWVQPKLSNCVYNTAIVCQEAGFTGTAGSGGFTPADELNVTCTEWTDLNGTAGTTVQGTRSVGWLTNNLAPCNVKNAIACCAP